MGSIAGGWEYIIGAYVVTWVVLGGYTLSLFVRAAPPPEEVS